MANDERQCHGCKRILGPDDESTTVKFEGKSVTLGNKCCWGRAIRSIQSLPGMVQRAFGKLPDVQDESNNLSHTEGKGMPETGMLICARGTENDSLWIGRAGGAVTMTPLGFRDDAAEKKAVQTPQKEVPGTETPPPAPPKEPEHPNYSMMLEAKSVAGLVRYSELQDIVAFFVRHFPELVAKVIEHESDRMAKWNIIVVRDEE